MGASRVAWRWQNAKALSRKNVLAGLSAFYVVAVIAAGLLAKTSEAENAPVELKLVVGTPFRFVAYGDARFHDPQDTAAANPEARVLLVQAIAQAAPSFVCFSGDLVYKGSDRNDWNVWDSETRIWSDHHIPVYPALGNHDLKGNEKIALENYFQRFPELSRHRYYDVRAANVLILVLDSSMSEVAGEQGAWLNGKLDNLPADVDFVFILLHHPPYTNSTEKAFGGGHAARPMEEDLARLLEQRQARTAAHFIVVAGHVHNYERYEHGGVSYFVSGGGGAPPYIIKRAPGDPLYGKDINYHYLLIEVDHRQVKITMNRLELINGQPSWTQPDTITIENKVNAASPPAR